MNPLIKYCAIGVAIQLVSVGILVIVTGPTALLAIISLYYPTIFLITKIGGFAGESTMMLPVFFGIPLGVVLYGMIIGIIMSLLRARRNSRV